MKIKKILAAAAAAAVAVSAMAVSVFAMPSDGTVGGYADGTAYLNLNKADWSEFEGEWTNAEIAGDGAYTVSVKMAEATDLGQFNCLEVKNGETKFGTTYTITVDSIKINGVEAKSAEGYTASRDGKGVDTIVNIYNEWNNPDDTATNTDGAIDQRSADGDVMSKTARMVANMDDMAGTETIEVTFTVSGIGGGAPAEEPTASNDVPAADTAPTTPATTGNVPAAAVVSVMAVAGAAAVASKKRK